MSGEVGIEARERLLGVEAEREEALRRRAAVDPRIGAAEIDRSGLGVPASGEAQAEAFVQKGPEEDPAHRDAQEAPEDPAPNPGFFTDGRV